MKITVKIFRGGQKNSKLGEINNVSLTNFTKRYTYTKNTLYTEYIIESQLKIELLIIVLMYVSVNYIKLIKI